MLSSLCGRFSSFNSGTHPNGVPSTSSLSNLRAASSIDLPAEHSLPRTPRRSPRDGRRAHRATRPAPPLPFHLSVADQKSRRRPAQHQQASSTWPAHLPVSPGARSRGLRIISPGRASRSPGRASRWSLRFRAIPFQDPDHARPAPTGSPSPSRGSAR